MISTTFLLYVVGLGLLYFGTVQSADWDYDDSGSHGPSHWSDTYADCGGDHQSPIDIDTHEAAEDDVLDDFQFEHYGDTDGVTLDLENDGHTAKLTLSGAELRLSHGNLTEDYVFDQLHFHWGHDDTVGSEHTIDSHHYPLEMHLVHHASHYDDLSDALTHENGLAVLAFLFEVSDHDNEDLDGVIDALDDIHDADAHHSVTTFSLEHLIHDAIGPYYRYSGSLTTPGCHESVIWTVFSHTIPISASQLDHFRHLLDEDDHDIEDNHRPVQDLHSRHVTFHDDHSKGATSAAMSCTLLVMAAILVIMF